MICRRAPLLGPWGSLSRLPRPVVVGQTPLCSRICCSNRTKQGHLNGRGTSTDQCIGYSQA